MPKRYPEEFREDVIRVVLARDRDVSLAQIAEGFGIHVGTLDKWLRQERIEDGEQEGVCRKDSQEVRQLRRCNRLIEQESGAAACLSQAHLSGKGTSRLLQAAGVRRFSCVVDVPGIKAPRAQYYLWLAEPATDSKAYPCPTGTGVAGG